MTNKICGRWIISELLLNFQEIEIRHLSLKIIKWLKSTPNALSIYVLVF